MVNVIDERGALLRFLRYGDSMKGEHGAALLQETVKSLLTVTPKHAVRILQGSAEYGSPAKDAIKSLQSF